MSRFSMEADMRRSKERCHACAQLQLQIETGQYVPGAGVEGELHDTPRSGDRRARAASTVTAAVAVAATAADAVAPAAVTVPLSSTAIDNSEAQHHRRPSGIICNHCLCSQGAHEDTGPAGQRCCGMQMDGPWDRVCHWCRASSLCKVWGKARPCPAEGTEDECIATPGTSKNASYCTHCLCACAKNNPHKYEDKSTWVGR